MTVELAFAAAVEFVVADELSAADEPAFTFVLAIADETTFAFVFAFTLVTTAAAGIAVVDGFVGTADNSAADSAVVS